MHFPSSGPSGTFKNREKPVENREKPEENQENTYMPIYLYTYLYLYTYIPMQSKHPKQPTQLNN